MDEKQRRLLLGERAWKGSGLDPANRPAVLTREEHEVMQTRLAAGEPLSSIAKALGRPLSTLQAGIVVDDPDQAPPAGTRRETMSERIDRERAEQYARRDELRGQRRRESAGKLPITTWHAPRKP